MLSSICRCSVTVVQALSPGDVIGRALKIYRDQIGVLVPAALLVFAVDAVVSWVFDEGLLNLVAAVVSLVLAILYEGMVVQLVRDVQDGRRDNTITRAVQQRLTGSAAADRRLTPRRAGDRHRVRATDRAGPRCC